MELLDEADIVVTNPPFSLFREYIAQLMEHDKKFVVIGNQNAVTYKEVFPLIKENRIWLGCYSGNMEFLGCRAIMRLTARMTSDSGRTNRGRTGEASALPRGSRIWTSENVTTNLSS